MKIKKKILSGIKYQVYGKMILIFVFPIIWFIERF